MYRRYTFMKSMFLKWNMYNDISYFPQIGSEFLQLIHVNLFREINLQTKVWLLKYLVVLPQIYNMLEYLKSCIYTSSELDFTEFLWQIVKRQFCNPKIPLCGNSQFFVLRSFQQTFWKISWNQLSKGGI